MNNIESTALIAYPEYPDSKTDELLNNENKLRREGYIKATKDPMDFIDMVGFKTAKQFLKK